MPGFAGHFKVRVGRKRVLRLMRDHQLLAPQRTCGRRKPRSHDGSIIPNAPDLMWGTDATMAYTLEDGWVWLFANIDHYSAEAWTHVAARGDRFAALQPIYDAVIDRFGGLEGDIARGISLRHDWGPQYRSGHFTGSIRWLGINDSPAYLGEPSPTAVPSGSSAPSKRLCARLRMRGRNLPPLRHGRPDRGGLRRNVH